MRSKTLLLMIAIALLFSPISAIASEIIYPGIFTESPITFPSGLSVEEYLLKNEPKGDATKPLFDPVTGSIKKIQKKHDKDRILTQSGNGHVGFMSGNLTVYIGKELIDAEAIQTENGRWEKVTVKLTLNGKTILNIPVGDNSPVEPIQGLWSYRNHWVLEVAHCSNRDVKGTIYTDIMGEIIQDGESFSKRNGYQETFGFQLMSGKVFYYFKKDNQFGISFDNHEVLLDYSEIPHYRCCEPSILNPESSKNMVSFFARRGSKWYYVEIGVFK